MKRFFMITVFVCGVVTGSMSYAHEKRVVANQFEFIVGFAIEPAFSSQLNGVDLRVSLNGISLEGLEKTLKVTVTREHEKQSKDLAFGAKYKDPGRYTAFFLPSKPGQYTFHVQGKVNGVPIDEKFISGEKFHDVEDISPLIY